MSEEGKYSEGSPSDSTSCVASCTSTIINVHTSIMGKKKKSKINQNGMSPQIQKKKGEKNPKSVVSRVTDLNSTVPGSPPVHSRHVCCRSL